MLRDPKFWPTDTKFCGEFEYELRSGLRNRNGELECSCVFASQGDNSPFRGARPQLTSYSDSPYLQHNSTHFLVPMGMFGRTYRAEPVSGRNSSPGPGRTIVWFGKSAKKHRGYQTCVHLFTFKNSPRLRLNSRILDIEKVRPAHFLAGNAGVLTLPIPNQPHHIRGRPKTQS